MTRTPAVSRYDHYSPNALHLLKTAQTVVRRRGAATLDTPHLAAAVLEAAGGGLLADVFRANGFTLAGPEAKAAAVRLLGDEPPAAALDPGRKIGLEPSVRTVLDEAERLAGSSVGPVGLAHLLRAAWPAVGRDVIAALASGADPSRAAAFDFSVLDQLEQKPVRPATPPALKVLPKLARELTALPLKHPVVGREAEIAQIESALLKFFKPNPLLVGEAGIGKTAVVEGLAERIRTGRCAESLKSLRIFEIRVPDLIAGTTYHGQFEERLRELIEEAEAHPEVVLFLDEIHALLQPDRHTNPADVFKPALARGRIRMIGATTTGEYRRIFEKDEAMARRFDLVRVSEPDPAATVAILHGLSESLASHHGVAISRDAVETAVRLAEEFLVNRRFPDKAIDLLDRALTTAKQSGAAALDARHLQITARLLAGIEGDESTSGRLANLREHLARSIIGQERAIEAVVRAVSLSKMRLDLRPNRPDGVLLFTGPTGVGKSALAAALAIRITGRPDGLTTIAMADFEEAHSISRLIGAPPGYVGHGEEPLLSKAATRNPCGVLLLDEFEKAHPSCHRLFLEIFDTGRFTDATGSVVSFANITIIATANVHDVGGAALGFRAAEALAADSDPEAELRILRAHFSAELLGRFDEIVVFNPLNREMAARVLRECIVPRARKQMERLRPAALTREEEEAVLDAGYSAVLGVRHLERAFERLVLAPLAQRSAAPITPA